MSHNLYEGTAPIDIRYRVPELRNHLSERAFLVYKLQVEVALVEELHEQGRCSLAVVKDVRRACKRVRTSAVYRREKVTNHDIQAMVDCIQRHANKKSQPFIHWMLTSYDVVNTADARRFKIAILDVLVPQFEDLLQVLVEIALREARTVMVARTHGQHAVPTTFGYTIAGYVSRIARAIKHLKRVAEDELRGKLSGATGGFNAMSLVVPNPVAFERNVLARLGLKADERSTQIVQPEGIARVLAETTIAFGIVADLANDMRQLQRTEIAEVGEFFAKGATGSSAMPQKVNPVGFENVVAIWKILVSRIGLVMLNQLSEHERDLTNSAGSRTYGETLQYAAFGIKRMTGLMKKMRVHHQNMERNLQMTKGAILAEALRTLLAEAKYPRGHSKAKAMAKKAKENGWTLQVVVANDAEVQKYLKRLRPKQRKVLLAPKNYVGQAVKRTLAIAKRYQTQAPA